LAFGLFGVSALAPAVAQDRSSIAPNPRIVIKYNPPRTAKYAEILGRLQQRKVLETFAAFLSPLILPRDLRVEADECGIKKGAPPYRDYQPGGLITLCYEFVEEVEEFAPSEPGDEDKEFQVAHYAAAGPVFVDRESALAGPIIHELLHNVALAAFDLYTIPIWGRVEDAADNVAALLMLQFGTDIALQTVRGTAWFLLQSDQKNTADGSYKYAYLGAVRPPDMQRYYNLACMAVGGNFEKFGNFVAIGRAADRLDLSIQQSAVCQLEYQKVATAVRDLLLAKHVNQDVLKVTRTIDWLSHP
jgi:hypothetical protein